VEAVTSRAAPGAPDPAYAQHRIRVENNRSRKWIDMLSEWPAWQQGARARRLKLRCRKGIPDPVRGLAWPQLARVPQCRAALGADLYAMLLRLPIAARTPGSAAEGAAAEGEASPRVLRVQRRLLAAADLLLAVRGATASHAGGASDADAAAGEEVEIEVGGLSADMVEVIERDIHRTFPRESLFSDLGGLGQTSLFRVLVAYAQFDRRVRYCQGMGFLAALFLSYLPEEEAFWLLLAVLQGVKWRLADIFAPGLPLVHRRCFQIHALARRFLPAVFNRLDAYQLHPTMYAAQWVITIYTYTFPFELVARLWDAFLSEGWKIVYRVALASMHSIQEDILATEDFETLMVLLKELPDLLRERVDPDRLMADAFAFHLGRKHIVLADKEFDSLESKR
jgi:hypothetical protein